MLQAAILVRVFQQRAFIVSAAIERQALRIRAGRVVGKAEAVLHIQACAVAPDDARIGPQEAFVAVGEAVAHAVYAHGDGQQPGDEMHQVHIMAADVGEDVGVLGGHPVLEVGVAVIPFLEQARGTQAELAERAGAVFAAGHQATVVGSLGGCAFVPLIGGQGYASGW